MIYLFKLLTNAKRFRVAWRNWEQGLIDFNSLENAEHELLELCIAKKNRKERVVR